MSVVETWGPLLASILLLGAYELLLWRRQRHAPLRVARIAHAAIREQWARAVRSSPGHEVLAVQTIRNSVMAASISASTAVLAFVALASQFHPSGATTLEGIDAHTVTVALLLGLLLSAFLLSATAVRFFNHAGYALATPPSVGGEALTQVGARYVARAGHLYSLSLRAFMVAAPFGVGLLRPLLMPVAAVFLVVVLRLLDRPPPLAGS